MRHRLVLSLAVVTLLSAIGGAGGVHARSAGPQRDFVLASFDVSNSHFFVNAVSGPAGENPQGRLTYEFLEAKVDCLAVHGHEALVIADIPSHFFVITLVLRDNRPGTDELVLVDARQGSSPHRCPSFGGTHGRPGTPVSGDINVHNARET